MQKLTKAQKNKLFQTAQKELARRDFYEFCKYFDPEFFTPGKPHLKLIANAFQEVHEQKLNKLMISMPPRAGKSYITSLFCAWEIGKTPEGSIMRNSYAAEIAEKFSYDIRDMIRMDKYKFIFPHIELRKDKFKVKDWAVTLAKTTSYFCAGVGGPITGKGCNLLAILDDPIKNIEEAMSATILEKVWQWYGSTHKSRFEGNCPEIHIATRWSKKDPIGRLLDTQGTDETGGKWRAIVIPALDQNGESFCKEIKTTEQYMDIKEITDAFIWEAEFMQHPIEAKGLLLPEEELQRFTLAEIKGKPDGIIGFTDTADKGADYLCAICGKRYGEYTYITDVLFTQDPIEITEPQTAQLIINNKCDEMTIESNNGGRSFARNVRSLIRGKSYCTILERTTTQNKETRILMKAGYIKSYFKFRTDYKPGSDYDKFMRQLTSYMKAGKNEHDDANDAATGLAEVIIDVKKLTSLRL